MPVLAAVPCAYTLARLRLRAFAYPRVMCGACCAKRYTTQVDLFSCEILGFQAAYLRSVGGHDGDVMFVVLLTGGLSEQKKKNKKNKKPKRMW